MSRQFCTLAMFLQGGFPETENKVQKSLQLDHYNDIGDDYDKEQKEIP